MDEPTRHHPDDPQFAEQLRQFYEGESLGSATEDHLVGLASHAVTPASGPGGTELRQARRLLWAAAVLCTVAVGASSFAVIRIGLRGRPRLASGAAAKQAPMIDPVVKRMDAMPNLVAVRVHADWCPRCPTIAPLYDDLLNRFGSQAVMFVTLDITDPNTRKGADQLVRTLDLGWIPNRPSGPGVIRLIDRRNRTVLANVTGATELAGLEQALEQALVESFRGS